MQIYQKEFMIFANFEPLTAVIDSQNIATNQPANRHRNRSEKGAKRIE